MVKAMLRRNTEIIFPTGPFSTSASLIVPVLKFNTTLKSSLTVAEMSRSVENFRLAQSGLSDSDSCGSHAGC